MTRSNPPPSPAATETSPKVALLVETSLGVGRDILAGIINYTRTHGPWAVYAHPHALHEPPPPWFASWEGDGIIARIQNEQIRDAVNRKGVPVVDVLGVCPSADIPVVHYDDRAIAEMAAEHLLEQGFRDFAYFGIADDYWSSDRMHAFRATVEAHGYGCRDLLLSRLTLEQTEWSQLVRQVGGWIGGLNLPVGVMLCSDVEGLLIGEACRYAGRNVGGNVGLIGVGNDRTLCELTHPPLSSLDLNSEAVGYHAAGLLAAMMAGAAPPGQPILIAPRKVVVRASSDFLAIPDPALVRAVRYIRAHCGEPLTIENIAREVGLSRSVLQRRFRQFLNRSVFEEVTSARIRKAMVLLESDLSIEEIAEMSGFIYPTNMGRTFRRHLGHPPKHFRRRQP